MPCFHKHTGYRSLLCTLLFACLAITAFATALDTAHRPGIQDIHFPDMRLSPEAKDSSSFILPFSRVGNLILIRAKADSVEGNFILDTGCPSLVLNITYFRNYPVTSDENTESQGMTGPATAAEHIAIRDFHFGTIQEYNIKASLANLGAIENSKGIKVLGLIGISFLNSCEVIIDYENNLISFHVIGRKEGSSYRHASLTDTAAYHIIPFEITDSRIIVKTTMGGKKLRFIIDCAAETNILDSRLPDKVFATLSITGRVSLMGVGNNKVEAVKGSLANFNIGNRTITDMPVLVTNLEKTCLSYGGCIDGVLGLNDLSVKKIGFNFSTLKMYIWK